MQRLLLMLALAALAGCASGPPGPTLPMPLNLKQWDYQEAGGILPITGMLDLTIEPSGEARSACRRQILTDIERSGTLSREQLVELVTKVEAWTAKVANMPGTGKNHGLLVYGDKKAAWQKDASLPPELDALVKFLLTIPPTLKVERRR
ncbi:MAG TPA: hypothetical protein VNM14_13675 [Planctomycetota bacterium]|nr:hypothetical protein [Planctomycetota bacterium]